MSSPLLFTPIRIADLELKNRIVIAPMHMYRGTNGYPALFNAINLGRFAQGGAGLVFQEATKIDPRGCSTAGDLGLWKDDFIKPLIPLVEAIHDGNAAAGIQLGHSGRRARFSRPWEGRQQLEHLPGVDHGEPWQLVAPSALQQTPEYFMPHALSGSEITDLIEMWVNAAKRALQVGYDVLEIHAAHGYLLQQFLSPSANIRDDEWGGDFDRRCNLLLTTIEQVRKVWPIGRPLFVRISGIDGEDWTIEDSVRLAPLITERGVDVIDCSSGGISGDPILPIPGYQVPIADAVRNRAGARTMAVGMITEAEQAENILREGKADLIAIGRAALENPNWPVAARRELGMEDPFGDMVESYRYWLRRRERGIAKLTGGR